MTLDDFKFVYDFLYNLNKKDYYRYSFNGKSETQNKIFCWILALIFTAFLYVVLVFTTFRIVLSIKLVIVIYVLIAFILYSKNKNNPNLKKELDKHLRFRRKLFELIEGNGFYKKADVFGSTRVRCSTKAYYKFDKDGFEIKIRLDGSKFQDSYMDLEQKLYHLFMYRVSDVIVENGYFRYIFTYNKLDAIKINSSIYGKKFRGCNDEQIAISNDIVWNFRKQPHALVAGSTGSGKSFLIYWIIRNLLIIDADVRVLDPKNNELNKLKKVLGDEKVPSTRGTMIKTLRELSELITKRNEEFQNVENSSLSYDYHDYGYKPIFLIFDEFAAFLLSCENKERKEATEYLYQIVLKGRSAGVFALLATQRPDANVIDGSIRDQLSLRVGMGQLKEEGNVMLFTNAYRNLVLTIKGLNPKAPRAGVGHIYIDGVTNKPQEFYSPYMEGYELIDDIKTILENKNNNFENDIEFKSFNDDEYICSKEIYKNDDKLSSGYISLEDEMKQLKNKI